MDKLGEASQWSGVGKYNSGQADGIGRILSLFGNELPQNVKEWLYTEQQLRRAEALNAYKNAVKALKEEGEK